MISPLNRRAFVKYAVTAFVAISAPDLIAQAEQASTNYVLSVRADHADAIYRQGKPIVFEVQLTLDGQPIKDAEIQWRTSKDGIPPKDSGTLKLEGGKGSVTTKLEEPGFLQCVATFRRPDGKMVSATGGAGIDPTDIKPSLPVPQDFDDFWATQKKQLAAVSIKNHLAPVKSPQKEVEAFDLQVDCLGAPVSGYLARPADAKPKSLPIMLTVHGAGVYSSDLGNAVNWAKQGFLALDINAHGLPNGQPDKFYKDLSAGKLKNYRTEGRESRDTIYFKGMFLRLVRAIDFLTSQPEWDGRVVVVHGSSQGGAQSIVAAGLDPRVTFFAAGVPAMCDHTGVVVGRISGWPKIVPNGPDGKPDAAAVEAARYYDAMNFATRTKAAGIVTVGFIDPTCPPTSVYAAYNALNGKKEIFNDPPSTHTVSKAAGQAMREAILNYVAAAQKKK